MLRVVERDELIHFITQNQRIVLNAQIANETQLLLREDLKCAFSELAG